jgi:hypothetical protein
MPSQITSVLIPQLMALTALGGVAYGGYELILCEPGN